MKTEWSHRKLVSVLTAWIDKGPFIFYEVGGTGGIGGRSRKKKGLKGGPSKKKEGRRVTRNILVHVELT